MRNPKKVGSSGLRYTLQPKLPGQTATADTSRRQVGLLQLGLMGFRTLGLEGLLGL